MLYLGDCLEEMKKIESGSVDMVLCDLPFGTSLCGWDSILSLKELWSQYDRVCKGPIVLNALPTFSALLINSNFKNYRYSWVWIKSHASNPMQAKRRPLSKHEEILVFNRNNLPKYNPQMENCEPFKSRTGKARARGTQKSEHYGIGAVQELETRNQRYPSTVLNFSSGARWQSVHPTQKPVALLEYLIRTYTNEGDIVLDNTMGSGSTGVACANTGRKFIGIEKDPTYFAIAERRIAEAQIREAAE
jgi:site-specific DNA-methyltransferase (adenine-specific)